MIKDCRYCGRKFSGNGKRKYCSPRCKKNFENSLRRSPELKGEQGTFWDPSETICRPTRLNDVAAAFWDKLSPTLLSMGLLNVLSEDTFAELCDLYSRLIDINRAIDKARIPATEKPDISAGDGGGGLYESSAGGCVKESSLSDLKRKYSKQFLEYCKEFNLMPRGNPANFKTGSGNGKEERKDRIFD